MNGCRPIWTLLLNWTTQSDPLCLSNEVEGWEAMDTKVISDGRYRGNGLDSKVLRDFQPFAANQSGRVVFYPSSGYDLKPIIALPGDIYVFVDKRFQPSLKPDGVEFYSTLTKTLDAAGFEVLHSTDDFVVGRNGQKTINFFFCDNNEVLELIERVWGALDTFVGMRDGCVEGGNYECVNNLPFFEKVVRLARPGGVMQVYNDHSDFLDAYPEYIFGKRIIHFVKNIPQRLNRHPYGNNPTRFYEVIDHTPSVYIWTHGATRLTVEHDNILSHMGEMDGIFCSRRTRRLAYPLSGYNKKKFSIRQPYFFRPELRPGWTADDSLRQMLAVTESAGWNTIGATAFGQGRHENFLEILKQRDNHRPLWLRLFHIQAGDFAELKKQLTLHPQS